MGNRRRRHHAANAKRLWFLRQRLSPLCRLHPCGIGQRRSCGKLELRGAMPRQDTGAILRKGLLERPQEDVSEPPYLLAVLIQEGCLPGHRLHASHECLHRRASALEVSPPLHRTPGG